MSKKEKNITAILIVAALVIFVLGGIAGVFYQMQKQISNPEIQQVIKMQPTANILTSKVVQTATAYGQVQKIEGNTITLTYEGDTVTINVKNDAQIYSSATQKNPTTGNVTTGAPQQVSFGNIKVGDQITILFNVDSSSGKIQGNQVYIFSSPSAQ